MLDPVLRSLQHVRVLCVNINNNHVIIIFAGRKRYKKYGDEEGCGQKPHTPKAVAGANRESLW